MRDQGVLGAKRAGKAAAAPATKTPAPKAS
jgi:hypothetical protein